MSIALTDEYYMAKAIELAKKGWYSTQPNPRVGCILVRDDHIIAQGWHQYAGQGHAEVNALAQLANNSNDIQGIAKGATAYVTLEPCSHFGKTPPCSEALITAGVQRVVVAMADPNPLVAGRGLKHLEEQGIAVRCGVLENESRALNLGFIQRMLVQRPNIRCKMAMSLDGRTAMANGESQWITGADAREDVQRLRAESSAILTGIGTVLVDNPAMNVRSQNYDTMGRQPDRVVLDSHLQIANGAKMFALSGNTIVLTHEQTSQQEKITALSNQGVVVDFLPLAGESLSLVALMPWLAKQQYNDVLLEAGATLTGAMLQAGLVDELIIYMAPQLMGSDARGLFNLSGLESMQDNIHLSIEDIRAVGKDYRIIAKPLAT